MRIEIIFPAPKKGGFFAVPFRGGGTWPEPWAVIGFLPGGIWDGNTINHATDHAAFFILAFVVCFVAIWFMWWKPDEVQKFYCGDCKHLKSDHKNDGCIWGDCL